MVRRFVRARTILGLAVLTASILIPAPPSAAAQVFTDGFESGDLSAWSASSGLTVQSAVVNSGSFAARNTTAVAWASKTLSSTETELYARAFVNVLSPSDTFHALHFQTASGADIFGVFIVNNGRLRTKNYPSSSVTTSPTTIHPGWNEIQARVLVAGGSSQVQVWLDGTEVTDLASSASLGTDPVGQVEIGNRLSSRTHDVAYDDVVADTAFIGSEPPPPPTDPPLAPTGLQATSVTSSRVDLAWDASTGATGYTVYRDGAMLDTTGTTSYSDTTVAADTTYQYWVDAFNDAGFSPPSFPITVQTPPTGGGGGGVTGVVMAAGDIACDPVDANYNNGNGTSRRCRQKHTAQLLAGADRVLPLGDTQYECGGYNAFLQSYDPTWGQYKAISRPILADEDYDTAGTDCGAAGADGYFAYWGAQAGPQPGGYYSFDFGGWHFVALNSECADIPGGCNEGSPQNDWLEQDLAASGAQCTIAMVHEPRFRSKRYGSQVNGKMKPFWDDLYAAGAEIVLSGDSHFYERFAPQDPQGNADPNGVVQWVVGTGGKSRGGLADPGARLPTSVTGTKGTFGVLKITLRDGAYDWEFLVEGSFNYSDTGSASCH